MLTSADARRRWFGALFIVLAGGMLIWGQTLLKGSLHGAIFLVYWLLCFLFTALSMVVAILDIRAMKKHIRDEQNTLFLEAFTKPRDKTEIQSRDPASAKKNTEPPIH
jgi:hypothetical protein